MGTNRHQRSTWVSHRFDVSVRPWIITCSVFKGFHKTHYSHHIQLAGEKKLEIITNKIKMTMILKMTKTLEQWKWDKPCQEVEETRQGAEVYAKGLWWRLWLWWRLRLWWYIFDLFCNTCLPARWCCWCPHLAAWANLQCIITITWMPCPFIPNSRTMQ